MITVLFPASFPKTESVLREAQESFRPFQEKHQLLWPREVRHRRPGDHTDYLAGSDEERCAEVAEFLLSDREVAWFGRGGFGVTRMLAFLDRTLKGKHIDDPKRWMGYSDITALFAYVKSRGLKVECIHGPMFTAFHKQPNKEALLQALAGRPTPITVSPESTDLTFQGSIWGGNLAVLASLCGTPWLPVPSEEQAVFLEDVDEAPYRVDRYLTQLYDSGFFRHTRKIFLGTFTQFEPAEAVYQIAKSRCRELGLELLGLLPVGHSEPHSPLFLDRPYRYCPDKNVLIPEFHTSNSETK